MLHRSTLSAIAGYTAPILVSGQDFDWTTIKAEPNLIYHDCYDKFKCARLEVPLDWLNASDHRRATIPILTLPATVPTNDTSFAGTANPGGPGGSGVDLGLGVSTLVQSIIDKPGQRHYELTFLDPRGIGRSTPTPDCFHNDLTRVE